MTKINYLKITLKLYFTILTSNFRKKTYHLNARKNIYMREKNTCIPSNIHLNYKNNKNIFQN